MPVSGYRSDKKTRYLDATGFKKLLIKNNKDLEILLTNNRTFAGF
jgi:large subunit ribosomal protein L32e